VEQGKQFSGQIRLRLPISLHSDIWDASRRECVSMSQFIVSVLAAEVGRRSQSEAEAAKRKGSPEDIAFDELLRRLAD
jgi:hypothetical protein